MTKVSSSAVLPALLCVWLATTHAYPEKMESRVDALVEPYERFTLDTGAGDPTSGIFGACLAMARTIDARLSSIVIDGNEYARFVPDTTTMATPVAYFNPPSSPSVTTTADCAAAAKTAGAKMFKYSGGSNCKLSMTSYDLTAPTVCEDKKQDAVFILKK